ncbi:ATP-dependent helicase [Fusobacterium sp.]|uniref:ATP-dependent helicase n=1 Tax=Fusobacterium sp. TaxID=68766 RepID=UPI002604A24E|nr:UvrD-helicase domain-containing protein [Fusobacterium sp.]
MSILDKLNAEQKKAGAKVNGPLLILAGAGSGKTRTITYRIAYMIQELGISPYSILAVTFTNKAAKEMRERVENLIGEDGKRAMISTFHSFGLRLLRVYCKAIGFDSNFTIYDTDDQKKVVKGIMKQLVIKNKDLTEGRIVSRISKLKEDGVSTDEYEKSFKYEADANIIAEVYKRYNAVLKENNGMDFSDILTNTYKLLENKEILEKLQEKFKYIMVDEYQDTNNIQYKIVNKIAQKYRNICVVGDENQSIYGFRGADIRNILDFEKDYKDAEVIKLEENYRSTKIILDAANEVIKNNKTSKNKKLWTKKVSGEKIILKPCSDGRDEVNFVIEEIVQMKNKGRRYNDFTILYRTNAQSRLFEEGFLRYNIPYKVFGGMQFYQRAEIKDILAYMSVINNTRDGINLDRIINVPKRKIGDKTIEKIKNYAFEQGLSIYDSLKEADKIQGLSSGVVEKLTEFSQMMVEFEELSAELPVSELFDEIIKKVGYFSYLNNSYDDAESRIENIEELKNSIIELENVIDNLSLREYLENVSLVSATDDLDADREYVKLMTIHNAKGLEFPVVFLVGMEDEIFPNTTKVMIDNESLEEERRICYVAITRAEEKLYMSHASMRYVYGNMDFRSKSRFIDEIPNELFEERRDIAKEIANSQVERKVNKLAQSGIKLNVISDTKKLEKQLKEAKNLPYKVGETVTHIKFGLGKVVGVSEKKIQVQFVDGKREIAMILADKFLKK